MDAAEYEHTHKSANEVNVNPATAFIFLLLLPYILFFALLMLITGETDLPLLYESVMEQSGTAYLKAWIIGSFVLAFLGALGMSGYRTKRYFAGRTVPSREHNGRPAGAAASNHYIVQETAEPEEDSSSRYTRLENVMDHEHETAETEGENAAPAEEEADNSSAEEVDTAPAEPENEVSGEPGGEEKDETRK